MLERNLEWYRVFYWTAKLGGLTKAAKKLHITQPAVSHTLKQLEASFGGALFVRTAKGVVLTQEGNVLFAHVASAFDSLQLGERKLAEMNELELGEIHIGAGDSLCKHFLLPYLEVFHQQYPNVRITVTNRTTPETLALLKQGAIDFGIVNMPAADPQAVFQPCIPLQDCLVGGSRYTELAHAPLTLDALREYPLLMLEQGSNTRNYLDAFAAAHHVPFQPEFELGSLDLLIQFAQRGFGLTFVPQQYIGEELRTGKLIELPLSPPIPPRYAGIAKLKGAPLSAATKAFLKTLPQIAIAENTNNETP